VNAEEIILHRIREELKTSKGRAALRRIVKANRPRTQADVDRILRAEERRKRQNAKRLANRD
jgi:hypothetical protein